MGELASNRPISNFRTGLEGGDAPVERELRLGCFGEDGSSSLVGNVVFLLRVSAPPSIDGAAPSRF